MREGEGDGEEWREREVVRYLDCSAVSREWLSRRVDTQKGLSPAGMLPHRQGR